MGSADRVVGYAYDGDTYCPPCMEHLDDEGSSVYVQWNGWNNDLLDENNIPIDLEDMHGNMVHPIFAGSEWDYEVGCYCCHDFIEGVSVIYCHEHGKYLDACVELR